ncbi:MAG: transposase [Chloroflexota bacterium]|nr:transposase [Chloroflexota bacterium]
MLSLLDLPVDQQGVHLHWSWWRRTHQAVARRSHIARRERGQPQPARTTDASVAHTEPSTGPDRPPVWTELTEGQWARVQPLLPVPGGIGRPPYDARVVLEAVLWLQAHHASWRSLPLTFGRWNTVYRRLQVWRRSGLWPRILDLLQEPTSPP